MMRMNEPAITCAHSLKACKNGIIDPSFLGRVNASEAELMLHADTYRRLAVSGELYTLDGIQPGDPEVVERLRKSDLIKLYEYYLRDKHPGRNIYDELLASANEKCPFCGGIGRPRNLDHFLPKTHFPQFSILPLNLIPSCRDCNMDGKGKAYAKEAEAQIIHPFLEAAHFFEEQWVFAEYTKQNAGQPSFIKYYADPPSGWSKTDKSRVRQHFVDFDIAKRYATFASPALIEIEAQIQELLIADSAANFKQIILQPAVKKASFPNHWKRVMHLALTNAL